MSAVYCLLRRGFLNSPKGARTLSVAFLRLKPVLNFDSLSDACACCGHQKLNHTSRNMSSSLQHTEIQAGNSNHSESQEISNQPPIDSNSHFHSTSRDKKKTVVCIEGNIGCGKTTLLNYFSGCSNCEVVPEPVDKWRDVEGYNALGLMYEDPQRWGMALQTFVQLTMLQGHKKQQKKDVRLMERSIYSAKYCFTDNLFESQSMPGIEHVILTKWFDWIIKTQDIKVDLFVYLRTDPELLHKRIMQRCRPEEKGIPVELLRALHEKYEDWLIKKKHQCTEEVLVIDANHSLEEMQECYEEHKSKILVQQAV